MSEQNVLDFLYNLFKKTEIFLARPGIQVQLIAIVVILVLVSFLSKIIVAIIKKATSIQPKVENIEVEKEQSKPFLQYLLPGIQLLVYPILALVATAITISFLSAQSLAVGILSLLLSIFWALLFYRLFLGVLYAIFAEADVRRFHLRLFAPLFGLFAAYQMLSLLVNFRNSAEVVLTNLFENPLTMGALFIATVGFYFWINGIWGLNDIIFGLVSKYTSVNTGRLEASLTLGGYVLIGIGVVGVLSTLGINSTTFAAITGGLSIGIGFGLQDIFSNFVSGIVLLFEGEIKPGDYLDINGNWAEVKKMRIRSTLVRTFDGFEIIVPNQKLLTSSVTNYTREDNSYRTILMITVDYDCDTDLVQKLLTEIVEKNPLCLPKSRVGIRNFGESGYNFRIEAWMDCTKTGFVVFYNSIIVMIRDAFKKHNIEFHIPKQIELSKKIDFLPNTALEKTASDKLTQSV